MSDWGSSQHSLYYTRIEIGSPPKGYYVQVDTGSDILWVNCIRCDGCPTRSGLGVLLHLTISMARPHQAMRDAPMPCLSLWSLPAWCDDFCREESSFPARWFGCR